MPGKSYEGSDYNSHSRKASTSKYREPATESSQNSDEPTQWEILDILEEKNREFKVRWAGLDPETGRPWSPSWVDKSQCNAPDLVRAWKRKKARAKKELDKGMKQDRKSSSRVSDSRKAAREPHRTIVRSPGVIGDRRSTSKSVHGRTPPSEFSRNTGEPAEVETLELDQALMGVKRKTSDIDRGRSDYTNSTESHESEVRPSRRPKRRRVASFQDQSADGNRPAFIGHWRDEIVPETQPVVQDRESAPNESHQAPSRARIDKKADTVGLRKSQFSRLKALLPTGITKPLRPLNAMSPSVFKKHLPSQDPIEDFSSPEKHLKKRNISGTIQESTPLVSQVSQPMILIRQMEEAYVDFSGGTVSRTPSSPVKHVEVRSPHIHVSLPSSCGPFPALDTTLLQADEQSCRIPLPSTASSQLADVDSQSLITHGPDSQVPAFDWREKLREQEDVICALRGEIARLEEYAEAALLQEGQADIQIMQLEEEIEALRSAHTVSSSHHDLKQERAEDLAAAQAHVQELESTIFNIGNTCRQAWHSMFEERVQTLQTEVRRWKGMCHIQQMKDKRTDDEIRRKAAEHSGLSARISQLEAKVQSQEDGYGQLEERFLAQEAKNSALQHALDDAQQQLYHGKERFSELLSAQSELEHIKENFRMLSTKNRDLQNELSRVAGIRAQSEDLLAAHTKSDRSLAQCQPADLFVCRYVLNGEPCHGLFTSAEAVRNHALRIHYGLNSSEGDA